MGVGRRWSLSPSGPIASFRPLGCLQQEASTLAFVSESSKESFCSPDTRKGNKFARGRRFIVARIFLKLSTIERSPMFCQRFSNAGHHEASCTRRPYHWRNRVRPEITLLAQFWPSAIAFGIINSKMTTTVGVQEPGCYGFGGLLVWALSVPVWDLSVSVVSSVTFAGLWARCGGGTLSCCSATNSHPLSEQR